METPRSSFRLRKRTRDQIEAIRSAMLRESSYGAVSKTTVVERAIAALHHKLCPDEPTPVKPARTPTT